MHQMEPAAFHVHQHPIKVADCVRPAGSLQPANLSFKDLQSMCKSMSMELKPLPAKDTRSPKVLACYGFPGLGRRHESDDEVALPMAPLTPPCRSDRYLFHNDGSCCAPCIHPCQPVWSQFWERFAYLTAVVRLSNVLTLFSVSPHVDVPPAGFFSVGARSWLLGTITHTAMPLL